MQVFCKSTFIKIDIKFFTYTLKTGVFNNTPRCVFSAVEEGGRRGAEPPLYNFKGG